MKKTGEKNAISLSEKEARYSLASGEKGWALVFWFLIAMCLDQFVVAVPFENVVFPLLVIAAATLTPAKNAVLIVVYSVIFELSCIGWFVTELPRVHFWLLEVTVGYFMPFAVYKLVNGGHKDMSVFGYAAIAAVGELLYYWVSVVATVLIWKVPFVSYFASDIAFEIAGCAATFVCTLPVALIYKATTGELKLGKNKIRAPLSAV